MLQSSTITLNATQLFQASNNCLASMSPTQMHQKIQGGLMSSFDLDSKIGQSSMEKNSLPS